MNAEVAQYIPVLFLVLLAMLFTGGILAASVWLGKVGGRTRAKDTPYECGMEPQGAWGGRTRVHFYLVAMLFILFDIAVVFLYPWAVVYREMLADQANLIFGSMAIFLGVLLVGYVYAVKRRAFDWNH